MAKNSGAPRSQEDYITQVSEEIEGRVTKRLSEEFSRTENRILGALARLDDFLMNPLLPGHSGTTPEPTRNKSHNNQRTNEDGSQNDPHPEAGPFHGQTTRNVSLEEDHDMVRGVQRERGSTITTWWQELQKKLVNAMTWQESTKKSLTAPLAHLQESRKRTALPVNRSFAAKTPLRRLRQTKFCWPFSSWQITTILRNFTIISTKFPNCQSH